MGRRREAAASAAAVRYRVGGEPRRGHLLPLLAMRAGRPAIIFASANCAIADFTLEKDETLRWYRSSDKAERGFCSRCGSNLFWRSLGGKGKMMSVTAGTLDRPTGLRTKYHIFCGSKSDYYELTDGLPQYEGSGLAGAGKLIAGRRHRSSATRFVRRRADNAPCLEGYLQARPA